MGRGGNDGNENGAVARGNLPETTVELQQLTATDPARVGELVELPDGTKIEIGADDPALLMAGLAEVESVQPQLDATHLVRFADGEEVLVDLPNGAVAFTGEHSQTRLVAAVHAALAERAASAPEHLEDEFAALNAARAAFHDNPNGPESYRNYVKVLAAKGAEELSGEIAVNPTKLRRRLTGEKEPKKRSRRLRGMQEMISRALEGPNPSEAAYGVLYQVNQQGKVQLPEKEFEERREAAKRLGGLGLIPEIKIDIEKTEDGEIVSKGEYYFGHQEQELFAEMRNRTAVGERFFIFRGPPGTGKDSAAKQFAALSRRPYIAFNVGPGFDWEQQIGGDGLGPQEIYDDDGNLINVVPTTKQIVGPLSRWAQEPSMIVIQEPEGMENELVRLHSAAGDNVGDPTGRYITINSSAGEERIPVHPDCIIVLTYNSGEEDIRFKPALHDRAGNFDFEYPPAEEEAKRIAQMVTKAMQYQSEAPGLQREFTPEEVMPLVKIAERARNAHQKNPADFVGTPGARQMAKFYCSLLLHGYRKDEDPVITSSSALRYLLPGSENMSVEERDRKLRETVLSDHYTELHDIGMAAREVGKRDRGEIEDKPQAKKSSSKSKSKKG